MTALRVALVVSEVTSRAEVCAGLYPKAVLRRMIQAEEVDLVAFPEMFRDCATRDGVVPKVKDIAEELGVPVLAGVWCIGEQMQCAGYWNPAPGSNDTREHFYAKHATSVRLAYELDDYAEVREAMFAPIRLRGRKVGVQLCHDMFFGLVSAKWVSNGANVLFDLTGSNVNMAKWTNVIAARSLEHDIPFLCTMANWTFVKGNAADAIAYRGGRPIRPTRTTPSGKKGRVTLVDIAGPVDERVTNQAFTDKKYSRIRIALGSSAPADVHVAQDGTVDGVHVASHVWHARSIKGRRVGILVQPIAALRDSLCIHRAEPNKSPFDTHVVVFVGDEGEIDHEDAIALAKVRAIEHRMAIGLLTPPAREMLKTNRYKNIQRFRDIEGVFGLDDAFLGGTYASAPESGIQGIRRQFIPDYRRLVDELPGVDPSKPHKKAKARSTAQTRRSGATPQSAREGILSRVTNGVRKWFGG